MVKLIPLSLLIIIFLNVAIATNCQISPDNTTFQDFDSELYGGYQGVSVSYAQNLQPTTRYYVRCRTNSTEDWVYKDTTTGVNMAESFMMGLIFLGITCLFYALSFKLNEKFLALKSLFFAVGTYFLTTSINITHLVSVELGMGSEITGFLSSMVVVGWTITYTVLAISLVYCIGFAKDWYKKRLQIKEDSVI